MRKVLVKSLVAFVFAFFFLSSGFAQRGTVRGRIRDLKNLQPLQYVTIYINFTTIGTYSDEEGQFTLSNIPLGPHELIVSHAGYQTYQVNITVKDSVAVFYSIKLTSKLLDEVTVKAKKDNTWKEQLKKFNLLFFGSGRSARQCRILNPWVLEFKEDYIGSFSAQASAPLEIENLGLGYKLVYQLKKFTTTPTSYTISGQVWFKKIPTVDSTLTRLWDKRRRDVYLGSQRHLFKAILDNRVVEEGFDLYKDISRTPDVVRQSRFLSNLNSSLLPITRKDIMATRTFDNQTIVKFPSRIEVHYTKKKSPPKIYRNIALPVSWLEVKGGSLKINSHGVPLNPNQVVALGEMSESRVSELLPNDYEPEEDNVQNLAVEAKNTNILSYLLEKPYLHTDRSYYYPDETIFLKAYMNYYSPAYRDSLSKALYVELIGPGEKIATTQIYQIDSNGTANGDIKLQTISKGDYQLRAYTRWMLNFDKSFIFSKPIKILDYDEVASETNGSEPNLDSLNKDFLIELDRDKCYTGEKIMVGLRAFDSYGYLAAANLSMSISEMEYSYPLEKKRTILTDFPIPEEALVDTLSSTPVYSIQYGIELRGQFLNKRNKPAQAILTIVQENSNDLFTVSTEKNGRFFIPGLQLYDSAKFSMQALATKGKKQGLVILDSTKISPPISCIEPLEINVAELVKRSHSVYRDTTIATRILDEVVIEYVQPKDVIGSAIHLSSDVSISGETLRSVDNGDLLSLLQSRISGLRVIRYVDPVTGEIRKVFKLGGVISFLSSDASANEPMVMVDGRIIFSSKDYTAAEQISTMTASEIDHVEVLKYGSGAAYGARGANGVIVIYTNSLKPIKNKSPKYDASKLQLMNVTGYSGAKGFKPTTSSLVYWNPRITLDKNKPKSISFLAPNYPAEYLITVEGVTSSGKPVRGVKKLTVLLRP